MQIELEKKGDLLRMATVVVEHEGERREGVVVAQWLDEGSRYVVIKMAMNVDDPDDLDEWLDEEELSQSRKGPSSTPKPSSSTRSR